MMLRRYQAAVIALLGIVYFINLPGYAATVDSAVPRIFIAQTFVALVLPVAYRVAVSPGLLHRVATNPLMYWCWAYLLIACLWYFLSGHSAVEERVFRYRILMVIHLAGFLLLFSEDWSAALARKALVAASLIAVALNFVDFANPGLFVSLDDPFANPGRGAGFYINANRAGAALAIGFFLGAGVVPRRWRVGYLMLVMIGIAATLSRAAVVALGAGMLIAWGARILPMRQIFAAISLLAVVAAVTLTALFADLGWASTANLDNVADRLSFFSDPLGAIDRYSGDRIEVMRIAFRYFAEYPLLGHGIGSTYTWRFDVSTHNMYLYFMVEYGVIGLLLFPALVWACVHGSRAPERPWLLSYAAVLLVMGFFTHNAAEEPFFIISYALAASVTGMSRRSSAGESGPSPRTVDA